MRKWSIWRVFEKLKLPFKQCYQTCNFLRGQKLVKKAKLQKCKCDILSYFQTLCNVTHAHQTLSILRMKLSVSLHYLRIPILPIHLRYRNFFFRIFAAKRNKCLFMTLLCLFLHYAVIKQSTAV